MKCTMWTDRHFVKKTNKTSGLETKNKKIVREI